MARRKPKYKNDPQPMKPEIKRRFELLMKKGKEEKSNIKKPTGNLWRWNTLEDVEFPDQ